MTEDRQLEARLRRRLTADAAYQPVMAQVIDDAPWPRRAVVQPRVRAGSIGSSRSLAMLLLLLLLALLIASTALLIGGTRIRDLAKVPSPSPSAASTRGVATFPGGDFWSLVVDWTTKHQPGTMPISADVAVVADGHVWVQGCCFFTTGSAGLYRAGSPLRIDLVGITLELIGEHRLRLDDTLDRFVPDWPGAASITIRQLLDGSSGVAAFGEPVEALATTVAAAPVQSWSPADALVIARSRPARFAPGTRHELVDTDDALLSAVLESVTGAPVRNALVARVLTPFQLSMTYPAGDEVPLPGSDPDPSRHTNDGGPPSIESAGEISKGRWDPTGSGTLRESTDLPPHVLAVLGPARGMASGATDIARMNDSWRTDPTYLSAGSRDLLTRSFEDGGFGGVAMCPCQGSRRLAVGLLGRVGPYLSLVVYLPADRMTVAIAMNIDVGDDEIEAYAQDVFDLIAPAFR